MCGTQTLLRRRSAPRVRTWSVLLHTVRCRQLVAWQLDFVAQARGSVFGRLVAGLVRLRLRWSAAAVVIGFRAVRGSVCVFLWVLGLVAGKNARSSADG